MQLFITKRISGKQGKDAEQRIPIFKVVKTSSRECRAYVTIKSWEKAIEYLENHNMDLDNESTWRKIVKYTVHPNESAELEYVENSKGFGYDYLVNISIEPAYCFE